MEGLPSILITNLSSATIKMLASKRNKEPYTFYSKKILSVILPSA